MNEPLTSVDFAALSPFIILLFGALAVLLVEAISHHASSRWSWVISISTLVLSLHASLYAPMSTHPLLTPWLRFDHLSTLFQVFFILIGVASVLLALAFFKHFEVTQGEYHFLLLSALFGLMLIGSSADFLTLFLGIETLSLALYVMCGYIKSWKISHEAAIKYFLIGSLAASILLYGIAFIYGAIGTTRFDQLLSGYRQLSDPSYRSLFLGGIGLVTAGLLFKAAVVPFHLWAPDVYDGAATPVTAFMAVGTKVGAFAALAIVFLVFLPHFDPLWNSALSIFSYATLIYANFLALKQTQLRRFFAYSGIAHAGYLLIPLIAMTPDSLNALIFYLVVYSFATLGAFAVLAFLDDQSDGVLIKDLKGLFFRSPVLACILALCFLTLAGIPPTAGFLSKLYVFKVAFESGYYGLVIVALITAILSAYYYLRMVTQMFAYSPHEERPPAKLWPAALVATAACIALVALSIYPEIIIQFIK